MATNQPARGDAAESMTEFAQRRDREQAARSLARATGHERFGKSIRANQAPDLSTPSAVVAYGAPPPQPGVPETPPIVPPTLSGEHDSIGHPGFAESLIPVWGSGREAIADFQEGDYWGAALNGGLALSDLFLVTAVEKAIAKGGMYALKGAMGKTAASQEWGRVRRKMGDLKMLDPYQHGHHWLIPQNGWGKDIPPRIKNHPLNIQGMPSREVHGRIHGRYKGQPKYEPLEQYWYGTPHWSKVATGSAVGHPAAAIKAEADGE